RRDAAAGNSPHRCVDSLSSRVCVPDHLTAQYLVTRFAGVENMPRAMASAQVAFGLVSIPVKLFSAAESSEKISFNMIHKDCGNRIQQQLFCPKDERTIERSEVVKG